MRKINKEERKALIKKLKRCIHEDKVNGRQKEKLNDLLEVLKEADEFIKEIKNS